jgi:hypothetical protein
VAAEGMIKEIGRCFVMKYILKKDLTSNNLREGAHWCHGGHASADYALGTTYLGREARYLLHPNLAFFQDKVNERWQFIEECG